MLKPAMRSRLTLRCGSKMRLQAGDWEDVEGVSDGQELNGTAGRALASEEQYGGAQGPGGRGRAGGAGGGGGGSFLGPRRVRARDTVRLPAASRDPVAPSDAFRWCFELRTLQVASFRPPRRQNNLPNQSLLRPSAPR